jgi:hypothetical protein
MGQESKQKDFIMTKEEVENKFSVGTKVKIINTWAHLPQLEGEIGTILEIVTYPHGTFLIIDWDKKRFNHSTEFYCFPWRFEVVEAKVTGTSGSSVCPRCNSALVKKEVVAPFTGEKYMINKCKKCGWC